MSEFISLEKLKVMDDPFLLKFWSDAKFPFDRPKDCRLCITEHATLHILVGCNNEKHDQLRNAAKLIMQRSPFFDIRHLRTNLEGVYSLRLFYKDLYADNPPEIMDATSEGENSCEIPARTFISPALNSTATTMVK